MDNINNHIFIICAYQTSEYLEECILSLRNQTVKSRIMISTSTPNEFIQSLADKYNLPVVVNTGESGIAQDWNFAYSQADAEFVTLAHQDDIYEPYYTETILEAAKAASHPLIVFTDYGELRNGDKVNKNRLLQVKRMLLFPLRWKKMHRSIWMRRRILSMGCAISCPTVTLCKRNLPEQVYPVGCLSNVDWMAWENISKRKGEFVYCPKICMYHRIHENSTTSDIIRDNKRIEEDLEVFEKFWPKPIARFIELFYCQGEKSNRL